MARGRGSHNWGVIHIDTRLQVAADNGCEFWEGKCVVCPHYECYYKMTRQERKLLRQGQPVKEAPPLRF